MSYHGPSSNVSAISLPWVVPLYTNGGPVAVQPASWGVWRCSSRDRAGNRATHGVPDALTGVQPCPRSVLWTCQRSVV